MKTKLLAGAALSLLLGTSLALAADPFASSGAGYGGYADGYAAEEWTGFHVGVRGALGGSINDLDLRSGGVNVLELDTTGNGFLLGVGAGYDYDFGNFVLGVDGDVSWSNVSAGGKATVPGPGGGVLDVSTDLEYIATIEARVGADLGNVLPYVHGGVAFARTSQTASATPVGGPTTNLPGLGTQDRVGYTLGAGVEYKVTSNLSLRTEYGFTDLGTKDIYDLGGGNVLQESLKMHTVTVGASWRF